MTDTQPKKWAQMNARERQEYRVARLRGEPEVPEAITPEPDLTTPDIPEEERSDDDVAALSDLQRIVLALGDAKDDAEEEQRQIDRIWRLINSLTKPAQERLLALGPVRKLVNAALEADKPVSPDDPPGTIYYIEINGRRTADRKKPWAWSDLYRPPPPRKPMPLKTWYCHRRMTIGWNGLMVTLPNEQEVTLPEVFYGEFMNHTRQVRLAEQHARYMFAESNTPPDDPGMITSGTAMARSVSMRGLHKGISQNVFVPGGGFVATEPGNAGNAAQLDE